MSISKAYDNWANQYDSNQNKTRDLDQYATKTVLSKYGFNSVLELGCGTGKNTAFLLTKASKIVGIDFSQGMLEKAREKFSSSTVDFRVGDLKREWNVQDESFDLVTSSLTLEHIEDIGHIFAQAYRKLVSEGIFFISELHPIKQYTGSKARYETENGTEVLEVYVHHMSEYIREAENHGFIMEKVEEWFDHESENEIPRILSFVFRKRK